MNNSKIIRNFIHNTEFNKHLLCIICQDLLEDPKRINCGHTFCYDCIMEWMRCNNTTCPICKAKIIKKQISRDLIAFNMINDMIVGCNNTGCPWKSKLGNLYQHLKVCQFEENKMSEKIKKQLMSKEEKGNKTAKEILIEEEANKEFNYFDFNNKNGSLKQRLFSRAPEMMTKVLEGEDNKNDEKDKDIMELLGLGENNNNISNNTSNEDPIFDINAYTPLGVKRMRSSSENNSEHFNSNNQSDQSNEYSPLSSESDQENELEAALAISLEEYRKTNS